VTERALSGSLGSLVQGIAVRQEVIWTTSGEAYEEEVAEAHRITASGAVTSFPLGVGMEVGWERSERSRPRASSPR
jgi:hypothetical protein